jgi:hypothetical protein
MVSTGGGGKTIVFEESWGVETELMVELCRGDQSSSERQF